MAPVERARVARGLPAAMTTPLSTGDSVLTPPGQFAFGDSPTMEPLEDRLRSNVTRLLERTHVDGWAAFREGQYRRAARSFETGVALDSGDAESRVGAVLSYLSLGAMRTAVVTLRQWSARGENPFLSELDLATAFSGSMAARELVLQCQLFAQASQDSSGAAALHPFVLWYVGRQDEALLAAEELADSNRQTVYARWPEWMRNPVKTRELPDQ
ncbi:MAG: hypothetical protein ABIG68_14100 [Acidobacteriota bacterium]